MSEEHRRFALPLPRCAPLAGDARGKPAVQPAASAHGTMALALVPVMVLAVCGALYGRFERAGWL